MRIGIPKEIKPLEGRVALVPEAVAELAVAGHELFVERGAGEASGFTDDAFSAAGATLLPNAAALFAAADMIVKVKEPIGPELDRLEARHLLFSYLHLAAAPALTQRLRDIGLTAVAFETVTGDSGLPLLAPMSIVAGRLAVNVGADLLQRRNGGRGTLLGGLPGADRGRVVVLGAGQAGGQSVRVAAALGAEVIVFDRDPRRLEAMYDLAPNVTARHPSVAALDRLLPETDLLVGAVLIPGAHAPRLVSRAQVAAMPDGAVIVDIAVDQGGCIETIQATNWNEPTYVAAGVIHFGVTNMPGAVPRTASQALSGVLAGHVARLARDDWRNDAGLVAGINVEAGEVVHPALL